MFFPISEPYTLSKEQLFYVNLQWLLSKRSDEVQSLKEVQLRLGVLWDMDREKSKNLALM